MFGARKVEQVVKPKFSLSEIHDKLEEARAKSKENLSEAEIQSFLDNLTWLDGQNKLAFENTELGKKYPGLVKGIDKFTKEKQRDWKAFHHEHHDLLRNIDSMEFLGLVSSKTFLDYVHNKDLIRELGEKYLRAEGFTPEDEIYKN